MKLFTVILLTTVVGSTLAYDLFKPLTLEHQYDSAGSSDTVKLPERIVTHHDPPMFSGGPCYQTTYDDYGNRIGHEPTVCLH